RVSWVRRPSERSSCDHCFRCYAALADRPLEDGCVVKVVPAIAVEGLAAGEVVCSSVPAPEPRKVLAIALRLLAAVLVPLGLGFGAKDAGASGPCSKGLCYHERTDVDPHAIVDVGLPADRLLAQRLPAHEEIMRRLAGEDPFELRLQMLGGGETGVCTLSSGLLVSALPVDPVTEVGVDQLIEGPPPFAIRCSSAVIVDQRVKTV